MIGAESRSVKGACWQRNVYIMLGAMDLSTGNASAGQLSFMPPGMNREVTRDEVAVADDAVAHLAKLLNRLPVPHCGGEADGMQGIDEIPLNRNNKRLNQSSVAVLNVVTDEVREVRALVDEVKEKLKDRSLNPRLQSCWTEEGKKLWQVASKQNSEYVSDSNRCLAVRLLDFMAQDTGSSFEDTWRRYLKNVWYKRTTSGELCAIFNVADLPIVKVIPGSPPGKDDADFKAAYNTYLTGPTQLLDWIRHPGVPRVTRSEDLVDVVDAYCTTDIYYAAFSTRWHYLYTQAFPMLSYTHMNEQYGLRAQRMGDFAVYKGLDKGTGGAKKYLKSVRSRLDEALVKVKREIFDKGKVKVLSKVHDELVLLKQEYLKTWTPARGVGKEKGSMCNRFEFKVVLETTKVIHDWFENKLLPSILEREPTIATVKLPPMEEEPSVYDKSIACAIDSMMRFDTDPVGWWCMKWLCNGPTEIVTLGGKPQSSLIEWGAHGPHLLRPRRNGKRSALAEKVPGRHIAFHMDNSNSIHLPAFQDWYKRTDEITTSTSTRAFTGPLCHIRLNREAKDEKDVFALLTMNKIFAERVLAKVCQLVSLLKDHNAFQNDSHDYLKNIDVEDELDDGDVDDALERNPVIREAMAMASSNHPDMTSLYFRNNKRPCFSKGILELFYSFQMGYKGRPVQLKRRHFA